MCSQLGRWNYNFREHVDNIKIQCKPHSRSPLSFLLTILILRLKSIKFVECLVWTSNWCSLARELKQTLELKDLSAASIADLKFAWVDKQEEFRIKLVSKL